MKKNRKLFVICVLSLILIQLCGCTKLLEKTEKIIEQAETQLNEESSEKSEEIKKQEVVENNLIKIQEVGEYPYIVKGNGEIDVEVFSSADYAKQRWMIDIINKFNDQKNLVDGKIVSVSLKTMNSEIIFKNIVSGKHIPDAIIPENYFLPEILKTKNIEFYEESSVLFENYLGFVIDEEIYSFLLENYKDVNFYAIQQSVFNNEIKIGIINDDINSLDFVVSTLYSFDKKDLLSDMAIKKFEKFKINLVDVYEKKYVLYNIKTGKFDGAILDYNSYVNIPELSEYIFIPFGVINNNPLYCNQDISENEKRVIKLFGYYATSIYSKKLAEDYGFIIKGNYISDVPFIEGENLLEISELLKNNI